MTNNLDIKVFTERFPSPQEVLNVFTPSNWGKFMREQKRCLTAPNVTLAMLSEYYGKSTSTQLVMNQYKGLHDLTSASFSDKGVRLAADLFLANYENQLSPYSLMIYFARYSGAYKTTYRDFDTQDILQQCGKKFLPWWNSMKAQRTDQQAPPEEQQTKGITLQEMVLNWVREGRTDESFHEGGLYHIGSITDDMIGLARDEYAAELANGCF